jgi:hypothetical protein
MEPNQWRRSVDDKELGELPGVTEVDGRFYLILGSDCMGPYASTQEAEDDLLPGWFGVRNAKKEE